MRRKTKLMMDNRSGSNNSAVTKKVKLTPFRITDGVMKIGKHKGKKLSEVPRSYLEWMVEKMDIANHYKNAIKDILK